MASNERVLAQRLVPHGFQSAAYNAPKSVHEGSLQVSAGAFMAVGIGAMLGAWLRWLLGVALNHLLPAIPLGTLAANLAGGFMIGVAVQYVAHDSGLPLELRLFVITGFLGALTTFSAFSAESVALLSRAQYGWALAHAGAHLLGSLAMTALGIATVRAWTGGAS